MPSIGFWLSGIFAAALFGGVWAFELNDFGSKHPRKQVHVLNGLRLMGAAVALMGAWWLGWPSAARLLLAVVGTALAFVPETWLLRIGGIDPKWELRALQGAANDLIQRYLTLPRPPEFAPTLWRLVDRMKAIKDSQLVELRDVLVAEFTDDIIGNYHFCDTGLRSIRAHQIEIEIFGSQARQPEFDSAEATFRWHLYRTLGDMFDCGASRDPDNLEGLRALIEELAEFRRPNTEAFIDALEESATSVARLPNMCRLAAKRFDSSARSHY